MLSQSYKLKEREVLEEVFNVTWEDVWYFAPRVSDYKPYDVVICLIWTSPYLGVRPKEVTNTVS